MSAMKRLSVNVAGTQVHLTSGNGQVLMRSQRYANADSAKRAARRLAAIIASDGPVQVTYLDRTKRHLPRLVHEKVR